MNRSVLDAGLAVLSFASGAVLGAFLLGTLAPSVRERDTFAGMIAGPDRDDGGVVGDADRLHVVCADRRGHDLRGGARSRDGCRRTSRMSRLDAACTSIAPIVDDGDRGSRLPGRA